MAKTILDYIYERRRGKIDVKRFLELSYRLADTSTRAFFSLYKLVEKSNDDRLKREAKKKFSHTVVELTYLLHQLQETANT